MPTPRQDKPKVDPVADRLRQDLFYLERANADLESATRGVEEQLDRLDASVTNLHSLIEDKLIPVLEKILERLDANSS